MPGRLYMPRRSKYRNRPTVIDGFRFASLKEARRYSELKLLEAAGEIWDLQLQVRFPLRVNGVLIETYVADFVYQADCGIARKQVCEDAKGFRTVAFRRKKKWMKAVHGIEVIEV